MSPYKLIAFDVDGTLIAHRDGKVVWELFNHHFCGRADVSAQRLRAFVGREITYAEWVDLDILDWRIAGARRVEMARLIEEHLQLTPGVRETLTTLRDAGFRLVVISGTLDLTIEVLLPDHPFEEVHTNLIRFDREGRIEDWRATAYDMEGKALALESIAQRMGFPLEETVFVGDNVNDLHVMARAGLAVAYQPKTPAVAAAADAVLKHDLRELLYLLDLR